MSRRLFAIACGITLVALATVIGLSIWGEMEHPYILGVIDSLREWVGCLVAISFYFYLKATHVRCSECHRHYHHSKNTWPKCGSGIASTRV